MVDEVLTIVPDEGMGPTVRLVVFDGPQGQFFDVDHLATLETSAPPGVQLRAMSMVGGEDQVWFEMIGGHPHRVARDASRTQLSVSKGMVAGIESDAVWAEVAGADTLIADPAVLTVIRWRRHVLGMEPIRWTVLAPGASSSTVLSAIANDAVDVVVVDSMPSAGAPSAPVDFLMEAEGTPRRGADVSIVVVAGDLEGDVAAGATVDQGGRAVDEDVQFTVYKPPAITPGVWYSMLAFAHKTELVERPDGTLFDPTRDMREKAAATLGDEIDAYVKLAADAVGPLPRGDEIRFVPEVPGMSFNPPVAVVRWEEPVHMCEFRLQAEPRVGVKHLRGAMSAYLGPLLIGTVNLSFTITLGTAAHPEKRVPMSGRRYRKIFPSYSHRDAQVVEEIKRAVETLGDRYSQDVIALRSGEEWGPRLEELIQEAHIFQLFWSSNSMRSEFVRREWTHALSLHRSGFIRPLYWELPRPESRHEGLPPPELDQIHFSILPGVAVVETKQRCPTCANLNPVDAKFCYQCGMSLTGFSPSQGQGSDPVARPPMSPPDRASSTDPPGDRPVVPSQRQQQQQRRRRGTWRIDSRTGERQYLPAPNTSGCRGLVGVALIVALVIVAVVLILIR